MERDAPADIHTGFPIGSCSKAFTAFLAATLIDDGLFGWDDQLRRFLPNLKLYDPWVSEHVTFRDVLANRSGLSRASLAEYGSSLSWDEVLNRAREIQPACGFRDRFAYCNVGFVLAAHAIQGAAGRSFEELMRQRVFAAHGMGSTSTVGGEPWRTAANIAAPHYLIDGSVREVPPMPLSNLMGASGQTMSARDAAIWLAYQLGADSPGQPVSASKRILDETHALQTPRRDRTEYDGYALGWDVRARPGRHLLHHEGQGRGFRATVWLDLEHGCGAFVAVNLGMGLAHFAVAGFLHQLLHNQPVTDWLARLDEYRANALAERRARFNRERVDDPVSLSRWSLEEFCGTYHHKGFGVLHISHVADHLNFHIESLPNFDGPLVRGSGLTFEYQGDRDAMAWPPMAVPKEPTGELGSLRFHSRGQNINEVTWSDWFGEAIFQRKS
jgi:CubicO group peptidase (beta-lactamase class C family)